MYILQSAYVGSKLLFNKVLLKLVERNLLFLILFFQISLLFVLCQDLVRKGIVPCLLSKCLLTILEK